MKLGLMFASSIFLCACFLSACGLTFGVDANEEISQISIEAGDANEFVLEEISVDDEIKICGGASSVEAQIRTVNWSSSDQGASADFVRQGQSIKLQLDGDSETISLKGIDALVPSDFKVAASLSLGNLSVCNLQAAVRAVLGDGRAILSDIAAPVTLDASHANVDYTIPIDLATTGEVLGSLAEGGVISAQDTVNISVEDGQFESLEITVDSSPDDSHVSVFLPPGGSWSIYIESEGGSGYIDSGDIFYSSTEPEADPVSLGIAAEINGGGPLIQIFTDTARILVRDTGR